MCGAHRPCAGWAGCVPRTQVVGQIRRSCARYAGCAPGTQAVCGRGRGAGQRASAQTVQALAHALGRSHTACRHRTRVRTQVPRRQDVCQDRCSCAKYAGPVPGTQTTGGHGELPRPDPHRPIPPRHTRSSGTTPPPDPAHQSERLCHVDRACAKTAARVPKPQVMCQARPRSARLRHPRRSGARTHPPAPAHLPAPTHPPARHTPPVTHTRAPTAPRHPRPPTRSKSRNRYRQTAGQAGERLGERVKGRAVDERRPA